LFGLTLTHAPRYRRTFGYPDTILIAIKRYAESHG
jgi:hypothetical protein